MPHPLTQTKRQSKPEALLLIQIKHQNLPTPQTEVRFHPTRRFRLDVGWTAYKIGVEIQGGGWNRGKHHRPLGYRKDCEKLALATLEGWRILWVVPEQIESGEAIHWISTLLATVGLVGLSKIGRRGKKDVDCLAKTP